MVLSTEGKFAYISSTREDMVYAKRSIFGHIDLDRVKQHRFRDKKKNNNHPRSLVYSNELHSALLNFPVVHYAIKVTDILPIFV